MEVMLTHLVVSTTRFGEILLGVEPPIKQELFRSTT